MTKIINFSGSAKHGKTTSANIMKEILEKQGKTVLIVNYADYLKFICKEYFGWSGKKDESGRTILQHIGTDIVRQRDPDFWVRTIGYFISVIGIDFDYILVGDCRFRNECEWFKFDYKVLNVKVSRENFNNGLTEEQRKHPSEIDLEGYVFDYEFNSPDLEHLEKEIGLFIYNHPFFK